MTISEGSAVAVHTVILHLTCRQNQAYPGLEKNGIPGDRVFAANILTPVQ
jgi:hypothetical protein